MKTKLPLRPQFEFHQASNGAGATAEYFQEVLVL